MKKSTSADASGTSITWEGLSYLLAVYLIWGSTYLAIRLAVREGSGFAPFTMAAMRVFVAGPILLAWAALRRQRIWPTRAEWPVLIATGLLLWLGGNGLVVWAEQRADSGYAALLVASTPIWVAMVEAILDRRLPSRRLILALLVGFAGIVVLSYPRLSDGAQADWSAFAALLLAPFFWAIGSVIQQRRPLQLATLAGSGYQHLVGGLGFLAGMWLLAEPRPTPQAEAWLAWGYLVVFGSLIGFTSFLQTLKLLPIQIAMTYPYVNPVVAVILGWLVLREPITGWTLAGSALVLAGVAGVFRERYGGFRRR